MFIYEINLSCNVQRLNWHKRNRIRNKKRKICYVVVCRYPITVGYYLISCVFMERSALNVVVPTQHTGIKCPLR